MSEIKLNISETNPAKIAVINQALQQIATKFTTENLQRIAKVANAKDVNQNLPKLLDNPMVKMYL